MTSQPKWWRPELSSEQVATPGGSGPSDYARAFVLSPFTRLVRTHACYAAGDAMVAVALAGSLFFSIEPGAARWRVALYLLLTIAPFTIVSPLIGPAIDRMAGGRRLMILASGAGRIVTALLMARFIDGYALFPAAFLALVFSKGYSVAKSALVPSLVSHDGELVEANSKLSLVSGIMAFAAAIPAGISLKVAGPVPALVLASLTFAVGVIIAFRLPNTTVAATPPSSKETEELRAQSVLLAAAAMGTLRATVGFLTFFIAFWFRATDTPTWWFGVVLAFSGFGALIGAALAPILRQKLPEEVLLQAVLLMVGVMAVVAGLQADRSSAAILSLTLGIGAAGGKLAFDSIVQRDAPDANQGRAFARFETRFQLGWVIAGFVPVVIPIPGRLGLLMVAVATLGALASYVIRGRHLRRTGQLPEPLSGQAYREVQRRVQESRRLQRESAAAAAAAAAEAHPAAAAAAADSTVTANQDPLDDALAPPDSGASAPAAPRRPPVEPDVGIDDGRLPFDS